MKFDHVNRRTHLYLALFLLPWFVMYGVSSLVIHHRSLFQPGDASRFEWREVDRRTCNVTMEPDMDAEAAGDLIAKDQGIEPPYQVRRASTGNIEITRQKFFSHTRFAFDPDEAQLTVSSRRVAPDELLVYMHVRAGFNGPLGHDLWAIVIDIVCLGFLVWIGSGLYMWWKIRRTRKWGIIALAAGITSFALFLLRF